MNDRYVQFFKNGQMVMGADPRPLIDGSYAGQPKPKPTTGLKRIEKMSQQELIEASSDPERVKDLIKQIVDLG